MLSKAGYQTAFFGKAHQGDIEESYLHNQGFDEALFSLYNQFASQVFNKDGETLGWSIGYTKDQWDKHGYAIDQKFRYTGDEIVWAVEGKKGEKGKRWNKDLSVEEQVRFTKETHARTLKYIREHANDEKPFYLDYWFHGPNLIAKARYGREGNSARLGGPGNFAQISNNNLDAPNNLKSAQMRSIMGDWFHPRDKVSPWCYAETYKQCMSETGGQCP